MMPTMKTTFFSCRSESPPSLQSSSFPPGRKNCENLPETERHRHARKKESKEGMRDSNGFPEPFPTYAPVSIHAKFIRFELQGSFLDHLDFSSSILPKKELVIVGFPLFSLLLCTLNLGQGRRHKKTFFWGE